MRIKTLIQVLIICLYINHGIIGQEDCGTAIPLTLGSTYSGDNIGANPDNDYSSQSGCNSSYYNSSFWYSFTTPVGVSSMNFNFTNGTLGADAIITIVDDCSNASSFSYIWYECSPGGISGTTQTLCNLQPSSTYYIQVASTVIDEGTFDLFVQINFASPSNDICSNASVAFGGVLECGDLSESLNSDPNACPDIEATGSCVQPSDPGVWYTFDVPADAGYGALVINPLSPTYEVFSTTSDCSNLVYEGCGTAFQLFDITPGTTYYFLVANSVFIQAVTSVDMSDCNSPNQDINSGNGLGGTDWTLNSCSGSSNLIPCQDASVVWYAYTVGCQVADLTINVEPNNTIGSGTYPLVDAAIMAMENDCSTIMSQYDLINGTGFLCSAVLGNQDLILEGIPGGTEILIAIGSDPGNQGYLDITVTESNAGSGAFNDNCVDAISIFSGTNTGFSNNCANDDIPIPGCPLQSQATVWFEYDPTPGPVDITINLLSNGISSPGIAVFDACLGSNIDAICGSSLELTCLNQPITIEIGSSDANTGDFDLEIISTPSLTPPPIMASPLPICSYENADLTLTFPGGLTGDIIVTVSTNNSPDMMGLQSHVFNNVSSAVIDDILINCGTSTQDAIYSISTNIAGYNCPSAPIDIIIPVHPKFTETPLNVEECLPFDLTLDANSIISGGTLPYNSYEWLWNGSVNIGGDQVLLDYSLFNSGSITLNVEDANGCTFQSIIDVMAFSPIIPLLSSNETEACPGDPSVFILDVSIPGGTSVVSSTWTVLDENSVPVFIGNPLGNDQYTITTDNLDPGIYTVFVDVVDDNSCEGQSNSIALTVYSAPKGEVIIQQLANCEFELKLIFYALDGSDIYGNGPDSNGDGIPDQFDLNNDGNPDFANIIWTSPTLGSFPTGEIYFSPMEDGFYDVEIITSDNCNLLLTSMEVTLSNPVPPTITGPDEVCLGTDLTLQANPSNYVTYQWRDENALPIGTNQPQLSISNPTNNATYYLEVSDQNGCTYEAEKMVVVNPLPIIQLNGSTAICPGETTIVNIGGNPLTWTYVWKDQNNNILPSDSASIELSVAGDYTIIASNEFGCEDSLSFTLIENAELDLEISGNNICENDSSSLNAGQGFDNYQWFDLSGTVLGNQQTLKVGDGGSYIVEVQKGQCIGSDTIDIVQYNQPNVDIQASINICNSSNNDPDTLVNLLSLSMTSDLGIWSSVDLPSLDLSDLTMVHFGSVPEGNYRFVYSTTGAISPCVNVTDTLVINVSNCACPFIEVSEVDTICNSTILYDLSQHVQSSSESGTWIFDQGSQNITIDNNESFSSLDIASGVYSFIYTLDEVVPSNCLKSDTFNLTVQNQVYAELASNPTLCNLNSPTANHLLDLSAMVISGNGNWIDPQIPNLDFSDPNNLDFTGIDPGNYIITFLTDDAISPCINNSYELAITVLDCNCPIINLLETSDFCNDNAVVDLDAYIGLSDLGEWRADGNNPQSVVINTNSINLDDYPSGIYQFIYDLENPDPNCINNDTISFSLFTPPVIESLRDTVVCNKINGSKSTIIDLTTLIKADIGVWKDADGNEIQDPSVIDFNGLAIGSTNTFTYTTISATPPCADVSGEIQITIIDCSCDDPTFLDPPILCNIIGQDLDLNDLLISNHIGEWTIQQSPGGNSSLVGSIFETQNISSGEYIVQFSLTENIGDNCQRDWLIDLKVNNQKTARLNHYGDVCSTNFNGDVTVYDLTSNIISGNTEGIWREVLGTVVDNPEAVDFFRVPTGDYYYNYTVLNDEPCFDDEHDVKITVHECSSEPQDTNIVIPNVFSPNDDGVNDDFFPTSNLDGLVVNTFNVYDRWGNLMFSAKNIFVNDPGAGWNGKFNNKKVQSGVYIYFMDFQTSNGDSKRLYGDVTLIH